jgi:hypothetical protein
MRHFENSEINFFALSLNDSVLGTAGFYSPYSFGGQYNKTSNPSTIVRSCPFHYS